MTKIPKDQFDFLSYAAHQMQHPLGILRGYLDLFFKNPNESDKKVIEDELVRLSYLISQILKLSKVETESLKINFEKVEIISFLRNFFEKFSQIISTHNFVFNEPKEKNLVVSIDRNEMGEALQTLLENAIKYTPQNGTIKLSISSTTKNVIISILDNGPGIPKKIQKKIFDPFYRGSTNKPGSGLGLSIAKKTIELHGGKISVKSEEKKFTEFKFTIPRVLPKKKV
ncbi:MAG: HAMP domain-containing histidine kinase [Candidatus Peregrinibacteria bacterium]|nr:HAMP domain-containing histidine kinase [Candidatus Peregrinibacteria bacterium]